MFVCQSCQSLIPNVMAKIKLHYFHPLLRFGKVFQLSNTMFYPENVVISMGISKHARKSYIGTAKNFVNSLSAKMSAAQKNVLFNLHLLLLLLLAQQPLSVKACLYHLWAKA